jgi:aquaporin Z
VTAARAPRPRPHWPEYLIEAGALGTFMALACVCGAFVFHPGSPLRPLLGGGWTQRLTMGVLMALTLLAIVYSPWGRRSGAHMNPAVTLTFLRLGKVAPRDAAFYVAAHFAGALLGVLAASLILGAPLAHPAVRYVVTMPGEGGAWAAFAAELAIALLMMTVVLRSAASAQWARYTGVLAALLVATFITVEAPLSGMSMNPARSFGSAAVAGDWTALWIYVTAPPAGMLLAARLHLRRHGHARADVGCGAKMAHGPADAPCIFCEHLARRASGQGEGRQPPAAVRSPYSLRPVEGGRREVGAA